MVSSLGVFLWQGFQNMDVGRLPINHGAISLDYLLVVPVISLDQRDGDANHCCVGVI